MSDPKTRTPAEQAAFDEGVSEAKAEAAAKARAGSKPETPAHLADDYVGPLTGDQAADILRVRAKANFRNPDSKPASVKATK